jgi:proline iminopeptidase
MLVQINDNRLNVEVLGPDGAPVIIVHHGGSGIGSLAEPKASFGWLADTFRVVVYDARSCGISEGKPPFSHAQWAADLDGVRQWLGVGQIIAAGAPTAGSLPWSTPSPIPSTPAP